MSKENNKYNKKEDEDFALFCGFVNSKSDRYYIEQMPYESHIDAKMSAMTKDYTNAIRTFDIEIKVRDKYSIKNEKLQKEGILLEKWKYDALMNESNELKWYFLYFPVNSKIMITDVSQLTDDELAEYRNDTLHILPNSTLDNKGYSQKKVFYIPIDRFSGFTYER